MAAVDKIRVTRTLVYEGERWWVEATVEGSTIKGEHHFGDDRITETEVGAPELVEAAPQEKLLAEAKLLASKLDSEHIRLLYDRVEELYSEAQAGTERDSQ